MSFATAPGAAGVGSSALSSCRTARSLRAAPRCQAARSRAGSGGGTRRQQERGGADVEIFSIDGGWNVEALGDADDLLGSGDGWAVESGGGSPQRGAASDGDDGDWSVDSVAGGQADDDSDDEEDAAEGGAEPAAAQRATFNGRTLRRAEERLLAGLPRHMLRRLEAQQQEADQEHERLKPAARKKAAARLKTHQRLRIISGTAAGRRLKSPQGDQTRPMMEMVRNAVFGMVMSLHGSPSALPPATRWLDLYAGTGAVGIEALSRGVGQCHFVEMSPWVVSNCLMPNLETCEMESAAVVHTGKAEDFLRRAAQLDRFAGGPFDFMSVCPPYELVDYDEIFDLLEATPLLHEESIVVVEYPKKLAALVRPRLGQLEKLRDRRYGRTYMAVYGPVPEDE